MDNSVLLEFGCLFAAIFFLRNDPSLLWKSFVAYLLFVVATEIAGMLLGRYEHTNQWLYNIYILFEAGFNSLVFFFFFKRYINSKPLIYGGLAVLLGLYCYDLARHGFMVFNTLTTTVMSIIFVVYGLYYYYLLLTDEDYIVIGAHAPFWWVTGTVFFYFGSTVSNLFFLVIKLKPHHHFPIRHYIYVGLICILYGSWTYSFLCRYRQMRRRPYSS